MDSQGNDSDVSVKLVFDKLNPRVLVYVVRNDADTYVHSAKSDNGGATWATPVVIPPDMESSTDYPFDLAVDSQGRGAAVIGRNSGNGSDVCGNPKVSRTQRFRHTFKTCDGGERRYRSPAIYTVIPASVQIRFWETTSSISGGGIPMASSCIANSSRGNHYRAGRYLDRR